MGMTVGIAMILGGIALLLTVLVAVVRRWRRSRRNACLRCGYPSSTDALCTECGASRTVDRESRIRFWGRALGAALLGVVISVVGATRIHAKIHQNGVWEYVPAFVHVRLPFPRTGYGRWDVLVDLVFDGLSENETRLLVNRCIEALEGDWKVVEGDVEHGAFYPIAMLSLIGADAVGAVPILLELTEHEHRYVRVDALYALANVAPDDPDVLDRVRRMAREDPARSVRFAIDRIEWALE